MGAKMKLYTYLMGLGCLILSLTPAWATAPVNVHVSILPQKYFVQKITGGLAEINVLVKPGKSPANYAPSPDQIRNLTRSHLYFRIGVPFENGLIHKIHDIAKNVRIVDTRRGIHLRAMDGGHDHHHDHHKEGRDPHIWMDPLLVKIQVNTMARALAQEVPEYATQFKTNAAKFSRELDILHGEIQNILSPFKGRPLFVFHPSFGYFTDTFGLKQVAIETMGKAPKGKTLSRIIKHIKKEKARVIFIQPQFDPHAAASIAEAIQGQVVSIDPLALDYPKNMMTMARTIARAMTP